MYDTLAFVLVLRADEVDEEMWKGVLTILRSSFTVNVESRARRTSGLGFLFSI